jgi:1-acyl-sn-glycerol-3-phosphate acyltransferase
MRGMHHIPVDRTAGAASFREALSALKAGEIVGVFPEATISRSFELKAFKSGAVRMAQAASVPVIPMVIWGSQRVWTKGHPKRLGRTNVPITLSVGEPIVAGPKDNSEEINLRLRAAMTDLLHTAQDGYPPVTGNELKYLPARLGGTAPTLEQATAMDEEEAQRRRAQPGSVA